MADKKVERILKQHYRDMLDLNRQFIDSMSRPRYQIPNNAPNLRKKLTKKQLAALARGRKILAAKRGQ